MKLVFVLGAGASVDVGYNVGTELKKDILTALEPNNRGYEVLVRTGHSAEDVRNFSEALYVSQHPTIDEFLAARRKSPTFRNIGRKAIVVAITAHESKAALFEQPEGGHWYGEFLNFLRHPNQTLTHRDISFITFNYDRSFEHFLYKALKGGHDEHPQFPPDDFIAASNFLHVHGHVGLLPWQPCPSDRVARNYGDLPESHMVPDVARDILVPDDDFSIEDGWRRRLLEADYIVFMGFGFHEKNLKRIWWDQLIRREKGKVLATIKGLNPANRAVLAQCGIRTFDTSCRDFIAQFAEATLSEKLHRFGRSDIERAELTADAIAEGTRMIFPN